MPKLLRHLAAILLLPFVVTVLVPWLILRQSADPGAGWEQGTLWPVVSTLVGVGFLAAGLTLVMQAIRLFATVGQGTLAPWDPPRRLVVRGVYRHVRNPMISGVFSLLLGEVLVTRSWPLFGWLLTFVALNLVYIPFVEEPQLAGRFGVDYDEYRRHVPRWIPHRTAWRPGDGDQVSLTAQRASEPPDPISHLGKDPVKIDVDDASTSHDKYLY